MRERLSTARNSLIAHISLDRTQIALRTNDETETVVATLVLHDQMEVLDEFAVHFTAIFVLERDGARLTTEHAVLTY